MKRNYKFLHSVALAATGLALLTAAVQAQSFTYATGDLTLAFRQSGKPDVVLDIGPASTYESVSPGNTITVTNSPALSSLLGTAYTSLNGLRWSVLGAQRSAGNPSHPIQTIWATVPRTNTAVSLHSAAWTRQTTSSQGSVASVIAAIGGNAAIFSAANPPDAVTNTATSIIIPNSSAYAYTPEVSNPANINASDIHGSFQGNVENGTPTDFTSAEPLSRSDLYQLIPSASFATRGTPGKLLGHFDFTPDGTLTFTALAQPDVSISPADTTVTSNPGSTAVFAVTATGDGLSYQWLQGGTVLSNGANISGSLTSSLTLTNLSSANAGSYSVIVSNDTGTATSASAVLTVIDPPLISAGPTDVSADQAQGANVSFNVSATGLQLAYQWSLNGTGLSGATDSSYATTAQTANEGTYSVVVSNLAGSVSASAVFSSTIVGLPVITVPPAAVAGSLPQGTNVAFTVSATGLQLAYQWSHNGIGISGATASSYVTTAQTSNEGTYSVVVTNLAGSASASAVFSSTIVADAAKPTVTVTAPAGNINRWTNSTYLLLGKALDNRRIASVLYSVNGGAFVTASLPDGTNWSATANLAPGTNTIVVESQDLAGNLSLQVTRKIVYVPQSTITLAIVGSGNLTTNWTGTSLDIGKTYTITAVPSSGYVFSNWSGTVSAITNKLVFALQTNETLTATFVPNPFTAVAGAYNGLFYDTNGITHQSAGFFTATLTSNLTYSGSLKLAGKSIAITGKFFTDGTAHNLFTRPGASNVVLDLVADFADKQITGTIKSGYNGSSWTAQLTSDLAVYNKTNNTPTNYTGLSTQVLPRFTDSTGPVGYGYGTVNVSTNGTVILAGATADGAAIAQTVPLSKDGLLPFYASLYGGNGEVLGWLNFNATNNTPSGTVSWIKTGWTNAIFAGGYTNQGPIIASQYVKPTTGTILDYQYGFGQLTFTNADQSLASLNDVLIAYNNVVYTADATTKVTFTVANGLFTGKFLNTHTHLTNSFTGVVLQQQNVAAGAFIEPTQTGSVYLQSGF